MSTNDAVSRGAVLDRIDASSVAGTNDYGRGWNAALVVIRRNIDQLPPLQPDGPRRSREEIERAQRILATRYSSKRGVGELIAMADYCLGKDNYLAKLFAEAKEEKTDGKR